MSAWWIKLDVYGTDHTESAAAEPAASAEGSMYPNGV